jgi:Ca2+-binding RTX toxin-like protein
MHLRTRLVVLTGTVLLCLGVTTANGVATASSDPPPAAMESCAGLVPTIVVAAPGMVTFGDPGGVPTNDVILGTGGPDAIHGLGGDDVICGMGGQDLLTGGVGNDRIFGQGDDDDMFGGNGSDVLNGGAHNEGDRGNGGNGVDACPATEVLVLCP